MKKIFISFLSLMVIFVLAACSDKADPVNSNVKSKKEDSLTLQEVFEKTTEASKNLKSVHSDLELKQTMSVPGQSENMNINSTVSVDMVLDPIAMHQKMKMNIEGGDESVQGQAMDTEAYLSKEGFFMFEPTSGVWMQLPKELSDTVLQMPEQQMNPAEQLNQLKEFADDFSFKQDDAQYILSLKASGDKFDQFLKDNAKQLMPDQLKENEELFNNLKFKNVEYEIFIDKKTFDITKLNMTQELEMAIEDQKMTMKQEMKSTYTDYNKIKEIKVPQEVLDNAQKIEQ